MTRSAGAIDVEAFNHEVERQTGRGRRHPGAAAGHAEGNARGHLRLVAGRECGRETERPHRPAGRRGRQYRVRRIRRCGSDGFVCVRVCPGARACQGDTLDECSRRLNAATRAAQDPMRQPDHDGRRIPRHPALPAARAAGGRPMTTQTVKDAGWSGWFPRNRQARWAGVVTRRHLRRGMGAGLIDALAARRRGTRGDSLVTRADANPNWPTRASPAVCFDGGRGRTGPAGRWGRITGVVRPAPWTHPCLAGGWL